MSRLICICMCAVKPPKSAWIIKLKWQSQQKSANATNQVCLLQSRTAVGVNSGPGGRHISLCSCCGRLGGQKCQRQGWAVISLCFNIPLSFSLFQVSFLQKRSSSSSTLLLTPSPHFLWCFLFPQSAELLGPNASLSSLSKDAQLRK